MVTDHGQNIFEILEVSQNFFSADGVFLYPNHFLIRKRIGSLKHIYGNSDNTYIMQQAGKVNSINFFAADNFKFFTKIGTIAGCSVINGKILRTAKVRVLRDGVVIYTGKIDSLRRFKDDVKEVASGYECGIGVEKYNDIKVGDNLEAFIMNEVEATL
jgi:translation initiation factor IF-2